MAIDELISRNLHRRKEDKIKGNVCRWGDLDDDSVRKLIIKDYNFRIEGFKQLADIIVYNDRKIDDVILEIIVEIKKRNLI